MEKQRKRGKKNGRKLIMTGGTVFIWLLTYIFFLNPTHVVAKEILKVGLSVPLTGPYAREAEDIKVGAMMAVAEWNSKGGVLGKEVKLIVRDDQLNPAQGARKVKEMVEQEGVKFVAGPLSSAVAMAIHNYTKRVGVLYICTTVPDNITKVPDFSKYTFHDYATNYMHTQAVGNYAFDHNLGRKFYVLLADYSYGHEGLYNITKLVNERGGEIIGTARHPLKTSDYSAFLPKILAAKPDILYILNYGKDQINTLKQAYNYGLQKQMRIITLITPITMAKEIGPQAFQGVYTSLIFYWELEDTIPEAKKFVQEFRNLKGYPPTFEAATGYSAVMEILDGIRRAGTDDVDQVIKALEGHEYNHYKGVQKWRECDHQSIQDMYILKGKKPSEVTREWDLLRVVGKIKKNRTCEELGHKCKEWIRD